MAGKLTMGVRNMAQVQNGLRLYGQAALVRAKGAVKESADRTFALAQDLCPRDTGYMAEHMREIISETGFAYEVGFRAQDFPGSFYPIFTEFGTRFMPAQPCIFPAGEMEKPRFRLALREALRPSRGAAPPGRR